MTEPAAIRLGIFAAALMAMLFWEWLKPFRRSPELKRARLLRHLSLMTLNAIVLRLISGGGAYGIAVLASEHHWGLFHTVALPSGLTFILGLLALDFAIYAQHVLFHKVPLLWQVHKVHHSDLDFDTTTAIRFHPVEIVLSMFFKMLLVLALGVTPGVVIAFEAVLNGCAHFNHGNVRLGRRLEAWVRTLLITPDLHRIHHSCDPRETDTNFGFSVPWWDRLCGTYRGSPALGQDAMRIGLEEARDCRRLRLWGLLKMPFGHQSGLADG
jgi:sterol desaturase/sphingolipid hydroxylase (fatty acid hydroxylase superfamily)